MKKKKIELKKKYIYSYGIMKYIRSEILRVVTNMKNIFQSFSLKEIQLKKKSI